MYNVHNQLCPFHGKKGGFCPPGSNWIFSAFFCREGCFFFYDFELTKFELCEGWLCECPANVCSELWFVFWKSNIVLLEHNRVSHKWDSSRGEMKPWSALTNRLILSLRWEFMSLSHDQELGQLAAWPGFWLVVHSCVANQQPACLLTYLLTITTTHKFPSRMVLR